MRSSTYPKCYYRVQRRAIVLLEDLIDEAEKRARMIADEKNQSYEQTKSDVARKVAFGRIEIFSLVITQR